MTNPEDNRFEDFFSDDFYVSLKNSLYNYRLRKRAVQKCVPFDENARILEVGSGLSPMLEGDPRVVYSDLSFSALQSLRRAQKDGFYVEADALGLPFKSGSFQSVVCSEVLEHISDDPGALQEIERVMVEGGTLILTFPHRRAWFALDDRFVHHFRRYEITEMEEKLRRTGFEITRITKVLGPLEKITMMAVIFFVSRISSQNKEGGQTGETGFFLRRVIAPVFRMFNLLYLVPVWIDARIFPRKMASVILIAAQKRC